MKKLFKLFAICIILFYGCGATTSKEESPMSDSIFAAETTEISFSMDSVSNTVPLLAMDSPKSITTPKDTTKRAFSISKLDTTSVIKDLKKNLEVIDIQQKQLDSLLREKRKK
jgi:hypothetical protein